MASIDTKLVLVQALAHGDGYGLELIDRVRDLTGGQVVLVQGRVYPVLRAIEAEGLAKSFESVPLAQRGGTFSPVLPANSRWTTGRAVSS